VALLRAAESGDVLVVVGGTIPAEDAVELKQGGVAEVFGPGATTGDIVEFLNGALAAA
jgi:methylmalonyl-CoA mutase C-terminal domain/subunit